MKRLTSSRRCCGWGVGALGGCVWSLGGGVGMLGGGVGGVGVLSGVERAGGVGRSGRLRGWIE